VPSAAILDEVFGTRRDRLAGMYWISPSVLLLVLLMLAAVIAAYFAGKYIERGRNRKGKT
jgi:hypothetical protein